MALTFGGAASDHVDVGPASSINTLNTWTTLCWFYPTTWTVYTYLHSKYFTGGGDRRFQLAGTSGNLISLISRSSQNTCYYTTGNSLLSANKWCCGAMTFDASASAGNKMRYYHGDLTTTLATMGGLTVDTEGSGTLVDDSGASLRIGNRDLTLPVTFTGRIATMIHWNRVLTLGELRAQQFHPHVTSGCVMFLHLGFNGTGTQPDWSGNGNNGTVTGAAVADHVPLGPLVLSNPRSMIKPSVRTLSGNPLSDSTLSVSL